MSITLKIMFTCILVSVLVYLAELASDKPLPRAVVILGNACVTVVILSIFVLIWSA